jgi:hypothetical protein
MPDRDTIRSRSTKLTGITALKLEALTDRCRATRGDAERPNFVLNRFQVTARSRDGEAVPVKFVRATASYSQARFSVENLLKPNNDNRSGWAVGPRFHQEHWAIFETEKPLGDSAGLTLTFTLVQNFGAGRAIGRLRLSASTGAGKGRQWPAEIAAILRTGDESNEGAIEPAVGVLPPEHPMFEGSKSAAGRRPGWR